MVAFQFPIWQSNIANVSRKSITKYKKKSRETRYLSLFYTIILACQFVSDGNSDDGGDSSGGDV